MKSCALFFVLINLSLATQLYATEDAQSEKLKSKIFKNFIEKCANKKNATIIDKDTIIREFEIKFDHLIFKDDLTCQERNNVFDIKCECRKNMIKRLNTLDYTNINQKDLEKDIHDQVVMCIAQFAKEKTRYLCERDEILKQPILYNLSFLNETALEKFEQEAYNEVFMQVQQNEAGCLSYIITSIFEQNLRKKIDYLYDFIRQLKIVDAENKYSKVVDEHQKWAKRY